MFGSGIFMQRDAGADPGFVFVEIDAHHLPLAHPDKIVHENWFALLGPDEHHPQLGFRFRAVNCRHKRSVLYFLL